MDKVELPLLKGSDREKAIPVTVIAGMLLLLIILLLACLSMTFKNTYKLHYSENSNLDYRVFLKPNEYYSESFLGKDKTYISSLIDYIDTDFNYTFKSNENIGLEYSYFVTANLEVTNSDGTGIYHNEEMLVDKKKFVELSNNLFSVAENVKIDYGKYNRLASEFISTYGLTADAKLTVSLYVDLVGKHAEFDKKISDEAVISLKIPLTTRTTNIDMNYNLSNSTDETLQYRSAVVNNPILLVISIVLAVCDLVGIVVVVVWVIVNRDAKTIYKIKLERILKDYERYISETIITERVEDMMKTRSMRIEVIRSFEGLLDIRDNLGKPILFHEERPGEEAVFYILADRTGYIYVMRADDMLKKKKKGISSDDTEKSVAVTKVSTAKSSSKRKTPVKSTSTRKYSKDGK